MNSLEDLLSHAGVTCILRFDFPVEVNFEGEGCGVENGAAVRAMPQMALNLACYLGGETPFQIFTNQSDCSLACHAHNSAPRTGSSLCGIQHATDQNSSYTEICRLI